MRGAQNRFRAVMRGRGQLERAVPVSGPTRLRRSERTQATGGRLDGGGPEGCIETMQLTRGRRIA